MEQTRKIHQRLLDDLKNLDKTRAELVKRIELEEQKLKHPLVDKLMYHFGIIELSMLIVDYSDIHYCIKHEKIYYVACFHCHIGRPNPHFSNSGPLLVNPNNRDCSVDDKMAIILYPTDDQDCLLMQDYQDYRRRFNSSEELDEVRFICCSDWQNVPYLEIDENGREYLPAGCCLVFDNIYGNDVPVFDKD